MGAVVVGVRHRPDGARGHVGRRSAVERPAGHRSADAGRGARRPGRRRRRAPTHRRRRRRATTQFVAEGWKKLDPSAAAYRPGGLRRPRRTCSRSPARSRPASSGSSTCSTRAASATRSCRRQARLPRVLAQAALRRGRGRPARARSAPSRAARRRRPVIDESRPHQYVYMIRDLGAKRQPAGFITVGSLIVFLITVLAAAQPRPPCRANRGQGSALAGARPVDRWASTCPSSRLHGAGRAVRRAQLLRLAPARAAPPVVGQGGAVRVRHRAQPRATRALPGHVLRRRDAVRDVRHRDHLHLPVRRRPPVPRAATRSGR